MGGVGWGWVGREEFRRYVGTVGQWAGWGGAGLIERNLDAMLGLWASGRDGVGLGW